MNSGHLDERKIVPPACTQLDTDEYSIFKYYLVPNYEFKQELRAHGSAVLVLEPKKLADEMKKESEEIVELYKH